MPVPAVSLATSCWLQKIITGKKLPSLIGFSKVEAVERTASKLALAGPGILATKGVSESESYLHC